MKVVFSQRKPYISSFSVESYFQIIREAMPGDVECEVAISKYMSSGVLGRIYNIIEAAFRQGDINHIAGDVHFLSYLLRKKKTLLTVLDCVFTQSGSRIARGLIRLLWYVIPEKRVTLITVISQSTKDELLKVINCNPDKIRVVHACISPKYVFVEKEFNEAKPVILQVGTGFNKNLLRLFQALKGIPCRLELIGKLTPEHEKSLSDLQIEFGNCWNLSEGEIADKYKECDLVTFVSIYEGFGMPILEANAVGRPVITGNIYSMPEIAGDAACLVNPYEVLEIRAGILRIIQDKDYRQRLVQNGLVNVLRFNPKGIALQYYGLYKEILQSGGCE